MKLLNGRLLLGCLLVVLVLADEQVKNPKPEVPEVTDSPTTVEVEVNKKSKPVLKTKILEMDNNARKYTQTFDSYGHHHDDYDHHHHDDYDHHHHPHHYYPTHNYYPPHYHIPSSHHYQPPYHDHPHPVLYAPHPDYHDHHPKHYPYSYPLPPPPPHPYHSPPAQMKPVTIIHATDIDSSSESGDDKHKPADFLHHGYLWNLIDQKNNALWDLFNKKFNSGNSDDDIVHDIVVIRTKPGTYTGPPIPDSSSSSVSSNWFNKGKNLQVATSNCKDK